jgi:hypothetical protein
MLCLSLRHIDLQVVYEQLDNYDPYTGPERRLANIPLQLSETLSYQLEDIAEVVSSDLFHSPWQNSHPFNLAVEVEEFIGAVISLLDEDNRNDSHNEEDEHEDSVIETLDKFAALPFTDAFISADYFRITALLIYQYDYLCWLYQKEAYEDALKLFVIITETKCRLEKLNVEGYSKEKHERTASERATKLAEKRHTPTNEIKARLLAEWDWTSGEYPSRADFSEIVARREGMKQRTLYEWIGKHVKDSK